MEDFYGKLSGATTATLIAILSGLGVGSGGLLVIWLTMIGGIDAQSARGLNLLFFVFSASAALVVHALRGRVKSVLTVVLSLFACLGTLAGTYIGVRVDAYWLKRIFGGMLVISGAYVLIGMLGGASMSKKREVSSVQNRDI